MTQSSRFVIDMSTLPSLEASGDWDVDMDLGIDVNNWNVNHLAKIFPAEANVHAAAHGHCHAKKKSTKPLDQQILNLAGTMMVASAVALAISFIPRKIFN
jgi:hypothetical protein